MIRFEQSIRKKIILGYYLLLTVIIGLSFITLAELYFFEKKIHTGKVISEFFDSTLEIRRFEKNYFLYGVQEDLNENIHLIEKAMLLLSQNTRGFSALASPLQIASVHNDLQRYRALMNDYAGASASQTKTALEGEIRDLGKRITTRAEDFSRAERKKLEDLLASSQRMLIFSILLIALVGIGMGQILSKIVVKPLSDLEKSMDSIADGKFERIQINSRDREIVLLTRAFNKVLKELELRQRHLVQSEKLASLGTLLSGVAHELNNPLSNISSSCQILKEEIEDKDTDYKKELLSQIEEQTDRARVIVRSLLDYSRERGNAHQAVALKSLMEETVQLIKGQLPPPVMLTLDIPGNVSVRGDKQRLQQAFLNLIKNAADAGGTIAISAGKHSAHDKAEGNTAEIYSYRKYRGKCTLEDDTVDIQVRDTGQGIPPEHLSKIFDPFFTTKDVGQGSGLGLFIVYEIIEEHDGCIAVESKEGQGTTFYISLPAHPSDTYQT